MPKFEDIKVGDVTELDRKITAEDVQKFCDLTGDDNPLHMDSAYASKTPFRKRVVHGMLTASFISTIIGTKLPGRGSLWLSQTLRFLLPVRIDDTVKVIARVKHKSVSNRVLTLEIIVVNQDGQKLLEGDAMVKMLQNKEEGENMSDINSKGAAIVTGASRGIGAAIALRLAKDGYKVVVNYKSSQEEAESVLDQIIKAGGEGCLFKADVRDYDEAEKMVQMTKERFGEVDVLVNNASGRIMSQSFDQVKWEDIQANLDMHVKAVCNTCKAVVPLMLSQKKGKIINIGSIYSDNVPPLKLHGYVVAKAALSALTKSLALEFGPKGLNINCVSPGMTETALIADIPEKIKMVTEMQTPLRRLAKPNDVANVVSFLAGDEANYLTGETIRVCGGQMMI